MRDPEILFVTIPLIAFLALLAITNIRTGLLRTYIIAPGYAYFVTSRIFLAPRVVDSITGFAIAMGMIIALRSLRKDAIGGGDQKLFLVVSWAVGWESTLWYLGWFFLVGTCAGIVGLFLQHANPGRETQSVRTGEHHFVSGLVAVAALDARLGLLSTDVFRVVLLVGGVCTLLTALVVWNKLPLRRALVGVLITCCVAAIGLFLVKGGLLIINSHLKAKEKEQQEFEAMLALEEDYASRCITVGELLLTRVSDDSDDYLINVSVTNHCGRIVDHVSITYAIPEECALFETGESIERIDPLVLSGSLYNSEEGSSPFGPGRTFTLGKVVNALPNESGPPDGNRFLITGVQVSLRLER